MKKAEREAKAEESSRAARSIIKAEEQSRRSKTERLRELRRQMASKEKGAKSPHATGGRAG